MNNEKKLAELKTGSQHLTEKYGENPLARNLRQRPKRGILLKYCVMNVSVRN